MCDRDTEVHSADHRLTASPYNGKKKTMHYKDLSYISLDGAKSTSNDSQNRKIVV
jgi:hypothetical protein